MLTKTAKIRVRFAETDAMGVVYHANYLPWFEAARIELMDSLGLPYKRVTDMGVHLPVLEAHLKYHSPARFDDIVEVKAVMKERPGVRIRIDYELTRGADTLVTGSTLHAFVSKQGAPVKPPAEIISKLRELFDLSEKPAQAQ